MSVLGEGYGSDQSGLISGYRFTGSGGGQPLDTAGALEWLLTSGDPAGKPDFVWLHFNAANAATQKWMESHLDLPDAFYAALNEGVPSTHIEYAGTSLVGVLNDVIYDFASAESTQVATLWLAVDSRHLVTARHMPSRSIDRLRVAVKTGEPFTSPLALLVHLMRDQGDVLVDIIRRTARSVDVIQDRLLAGRLDTKRASLGVLRRDLVRLQRLLAPEPAALFRLLSRPPAWFGEAEATELRGSAEEFSLTLRDLDSLQERIKLLQEEIAASVGERTSRAVFTLTAVTVLALPVNMVAGLFGMNVGGVPFSEDPRGFWVVVGLVGLVSLAVAWLVFRQRAE